MKVVRLNTEIEYIKLYIYLAPLQHTKMADMSDFIKFVGESAAYVIQDDNGNIYGGALLRRSSDKGFFYLAHFHVNNILRRTKIMVEMYRKICAIVKKNNSILIASLPDDIHKNMKNMTTHIEDKLYKLRLV